MIKKWLRRDPAKGLFELLDEQVDQQSAAQTAPPSEQAAALGQLQALNEEELLQLAMTRANQIEALKRQIERQAKQIHQQRHLLEHRDSSRDASRRLAQLEATREREAQRMRDDYQIRMKELSERVGELEGQVLAARTENSRLKKLLEN